MPEFLIECVSRITPSDAESVSKLVRQLSKSARIPAAVELDEVASAEATSLLVAGVSGTIVGMLTLVLFRIPTGVRAIIEDVIVDEAHRGRGIAEALTREALLGRMRKEPEPSISPLARPGKMLTACTSTLDFRGGTAMSIASHWKRRQQLEITIR
jgi:predicted GNAT family acetyltransferase